MEDTVVLAVTQVAGERYAIANGINRRDVFVPGTGQCPRGQRFKDFVIVGDVKLSFDEGMYFLRVLMPNPRSPEVHHRLQELMDNA